MSLNLKGLDSDEDSEVDHDFFDTPKDVVKSKHSPTPISKVQYRECSSDSDSESDKAAHVNVRKIEAKVPRHTTTTSNDYSDNFESDSDDGGNDKNGRLSDTDDKHKRKSDSNSKQAWGRDSHKDLPERPKTAKGRSRQRSNSSGRHRRKSYSDHSISGDSSNYSTCSSDSDSDVTDVSPLGSPKTSPKHRDMYSMHELAKIGKPPKSPMHKEMASYRKSNSRPTSATKSNKLDQLLNAEMETVDLKLLMAAVLEMEKEKEKESRQLKQRRVLFSPAAPKPQSKLNQTFSNDQVRTIDRENQRLMQRIVTIAKEAEATKKKTKKTKQQHVPKEPPKLTASAVNRMKEQRRIEQENFAMLKRLQSTRATKDLSRNNLLTNYNKQMIAGHKVAEAHTMTKKMRSPYDGSSRAMSVAGESTGSRRSRPTSAKSTASTISVASSKSRRSRPEWEEGW